MTYGIAWISNDVVFTLADTALTYNSHFLTDRSFAYHSSIGERQKMDEKVTVIESGLKVFNFDKVCITYAGDLKTAHIVLEDLKYELEQEPTAQDFIKIIVDILNFRREKICSTDRKVDFIFSFFDQDTPIILSFVDGVLKTQNEGVVQIGSIPTKYKNLTDEFLSNTSLKNKNPSLVFTLILSVLQSYGFYDNLFTHGVGGMFTGGYLNECGFQWQPNLIFFSFDMLDSGQFDFSVSTAYNHGCFMISTSFHDNHNKLITNGIDEKDEETSFRRSVAEKEGMNIFNSHQFDYVPLCQHSCRIV